MHTHIHTQQVFLHPAEAREDKKNKTRKCYAFPLTPSPPSYLGRAANKNPFRSVPGYTSSAYPT